MFSFTVKQNINFTKYQKFTEYFSRKCDYNVKVENNIDCNDS